MLCSLTRAFAGEDGGNRPRQNFHVDPEPLAFDVIHIKLDLSGKIYFGATADLPDAGNAWFHGQPTAMCERIFGNLARQRRARSHEGHVTLEHVVKLWQFVE